jgi:site-specific DNA-cytosine methylase
MIKTLVVVSAFDGISVGLLALKDRFPDYRIIYYVIEIDEKAMMISRYNHPDTDLLSIRYLGDIRFVTKDMVPEKVDILFGGSPCTNVSLFGKRNGMVTTNNIEIHTLNQYMKFKSVGFEFEGESYLYWEYLRLLYELNPTYFLLENVRMKTKWKDIITNSLTDFQSNNLIRINSSLVSAQNRERLYWTNIPNVTIPEDRKIMISDIISNANGGAGKRNVFDGNYHPDGRKKYDKGRLTIRKDGKSNCLTCGGSCAKIQLTNGDIRPLSIDEWEKLQTLPVGYTAVPGLSISARKCAIGNSWTTDVIKHIFNNIPEIN